MNYSLIVACGVVFLFQLSLGERVEQFLTRFAVIPAVSYDALFHGSLNPAGLYPLVTSMFLHGGWLHLVGNMVYLYVFGDNIEDRLGHGGYLLFYLTCGIGAGIGQVWFSGTSTVPTLGASGAIAGVLGAYFLLYPRARVLTLIPLFIFFPVIEVSAFFFLGFWFVIQFFQATLSGAAEAAGGGVAWWAHAAGFIAGACLLPVFILVRKML